MLNLSSISAIRSCYRSDNISSSRNSDTESRMTSECLARITKSKNKNTWLESKFLRLHCCLIDFCLPQRIVLAVMAFLGFTVEYMMRNLLSIAITQIVKKTYTEESIISGEVCQGNNETFIEDEDGNVVNEGAYDWSEALQGVVLSSFYWGYIITHIPGCLS